MPTYQATMDWLYSFIDSEKKLPKTPLDFNLPRIQALLHALGNPQNAYPAVMIAGTKGKGSTSAMIESIARHAGLRTGLFTSPHLHSYRERIQINREPISQHDLIELVEYVKPIVAANDSALGALTTYEIGVALGLTYFAQQKIELAILEIGLGGRYDAINSVMPLVSVISSISYDHTAILGDTLAKIAYEKAGIIKPNVPVITTVQKPEAASVIADVARQQNAPLFVATLGGLHEQASGERADYPLLIVPDMLGLRGEFQMQNAQLAASTAMLLREIGFNVSDDAIRTGLATTQWAGRFELVGQHPTIIVDGAHNADSARVLMTSVQQYFPNRRIILVIGTSQDKDIRGMMAEIIPHVDQVILTQSRHPRSATPEQLQALISSIEHTRLQLTSDIPPALELAHHMAHADDVILVTGSLFVVAAAREALGLATSD